MTKEELKIVADAAKDYPPGNGLNWGYGPLVEAEDKSIVVIKLLQDDPNLVEYG